MFSNAPDPRSRPTPSQALQWLLDGNARFAAGRPERPRQDDAHRRALTGGQHPHAVVLACSDSRVSVEILLDQGFGDLFVVRTAGHVLDRSVVASVEFAVAQLGVSVALVLGHESCGAVAAAQRYLAGAHELPGSMPALVEGVRDHLDPDDPSHDAVARHVRGTISELLAGSVLVREAVEDGLLTVAGGVYGLADGRITLVDR